MAQLRLPFMFSVQCSRIAFIGLKSTKSRKGNKNEIFKGIGKNGNKIYGNNSNILFFREFNFRNVGGVIW